MSLVSCPMKFLWSKSPRRSNFLRQSKKGWINSTVAKASRMKKSSDSSPHGLPADINCPLNTRINANFWIDSRFLISEPIRVHSCQFVVKSYRLDIERQLVQIARVWHAARGIPRWFDLRSIDARPSCCSL